MNFRGSVTHNTKTPTNWDYEDEIHESSYWNNTNYRFISEVCTYSFSGITLNILHICRCPLAQQQRHRHHFQKVSSFVGSLLPLH